MRTYPSAWPPGLVKLNSSFVFLLLERYTLCGGIGNPVIAARLNRLVVFEFATMNVALRKHSRSSNSIIADTCLCYGCLVNVSGFPNR